MEDSILLMLLLQAILIMLNAVFACAEIAVISINDNKIAKMAEAGDKRAIRLARLTSQPARFLATIQVAITLSGFLGSAFAAENFSDRLVGWLVGMGVPIPAATLDTISIVLITIVLSYFTLIFGELVPKRVAMRKAEPLALAMPSMISSIAKLFSPIVWLLTISTNSILRLLGIDPDADDDEVSEESIRMMVDTGSEKGAIDHEEKEFIQNVFEFDDLTAGEIATHRTDTVFLWLEEDMQQWKDCISRSRHTCYPVCGETADDVVGILYTGDYFRLTDQSRASVMQHAVKPAYFVPESVKADVLFRNMRQNHERIAVVLDEYSGVSGIITLNDLVEQLVGDLGDDEPDDPAPDIEEVEEGCWRIRGCAPLDEVSAALGLDLESDTYDTFNGLIFDVLGAVPQDGSQVELETAFLRIQVTDIHDHQVESAIVWLKKNTVPSQEAS